MDFIKNLALFVHSFYIDDDAVLVMKSAPELGENELIVKLMNEWVKSFKNNETATLEALVAIGNNPDDEWPVKDYKYYTCQGWHELDGFTNAVRIAIDSIVFPEL